MRLKLKIVKVIIVLILCFENFNLFSQNIKLSDKQNQKLKQINDDYNKAPNFTLSSITDTTYTLSELKGKVILINFWATWCGPCRMEIPEFNEIYDKYYNKGLEILGISISDSKKQLSNFIKSFKVDYPLLYGSQKEMNKIMKEYGGVYAVPSSFLIDKKGEIIWKYPGAILKDYDPQTFTSLLYQIEKSINVSD